MDKVVYVYFIIIIYMRRTMATCARSYRRHHTKHCACETNVYATRNYNQSTEPVEVSHRVGVVRRRAQRA